jgi:hypothetical protein
MGYLAIFQGMMEECPAKSNKGYQIIGEFSNALGFVLIFLQNMECLHMSLLDFHACTPNMPASQKIHHRIFLAKIKPMLY